MKPTRVWMLVALFCVSTSLGWSLARLTAAWTGQVRMLIELGEFREAKLWADKALERLLEEVRSKTVRRTFSGDAGLGDR